MVCDWARSAGSTFPAGVASAVVAQLAHTNCGRTCRGYDIFERGKSRVCGLRLLEALKIDEQMCFQILYRLTAANVPRRNLWS
jgi:hypothetical protein